MEDGRSEGEALTPAQPSAPETDSAKENSAQRVGETPVAMSVAEGENGGKSAPPEEEKSAPRVDAEAKGKEVKQEVKAGSENEAEVSALREWLELIFRAAFWALILYLFFFQVSVVEGPSMEPTFHTNDRLVIDKVTYDFSNIHRFDVVVFHAGDLDRTGETKDYIKRVIGLPGEKIELKSVQQPDGSIQLKVWINGKELTEPAAVDNRLSYFSHGKQEFVVPLHHYFVMGDNRKDSKDSRNAGLGTLGFVPKSQIRGVARLRFLPLSRWKWFWRD